ncbi:hypothetical protein [Rhodanobacter sp. MP1X3]|uniref:hypothetical protein n=1 Tax=Rhodanobacter sp. MP1X3 TaxID=2723086 RepID=UPI001615F338|nr:hypothetical protein [Rhodanobacter sp. MP1X3]MBB6242992.1 hypothetical protein [Rhodanobacter sp. MP1X3]
MHIRPWMVTVAAGILAILGAGSLKAGDSASIKLPAPVRTADIFHCDARYCAMPSQGSYPYIVIGLFQAMATVKQSQQLFIDTRTQHRWLSLPDDPAAFYASLQPVSITLTDGNALAVLMAQDEVYATTPKPGDLVRYSPHFGAYELPPTDPKARAYWSIDGCVAVICRAQDRACFSRYAQGVFRRPDGMAISPKTFKPLPQGTVIDVQSLLPIRSSGKVL